MNTVRYVHWRDGDFWLGYLEEYPDYWTQGESLDDLLAHLRDLYHDLADGHIPGARNVPSTSLLTDAGTFRDDLSAHFGTVDAQPAVYCGSGVTASVVVAALASVGVNAALFPGSWSQYSAESARPVALGE